MKERLCEELQVVVLLGGLGSRLKEKTLECPKPLLKVQGKPFFEYQLELMRQAGFRRFVFCVGHRADMIRDHFGDGARYGLEIAYSEDGEKLLGTGGAVRNALPLLEEDFMLIYGDSFMDIDYFEAVVRYRQAVREGKRALMTVMQNGNRFDRSNVVCEGGRILLYDKRHSRPEMQYIDYGMSIFRRELFEKIPEGIPCDLSELQHELSVKGELACCEVEHRFYEIGTPESLAEFEAYARKRWNEPNQAVFLDRDGVINEIVWNEDAEQLDSPLKREQFRLLPGVCKALAELQRQGYLLFIVTNQPAAAKGKTRFLELCNINHGFVRAMQERGIEIAEVAMCPHYERPTTLTKELFLIRDCDCRKPKAGLIRHIMSKYRIDPGQSWMVGDSATDIMCGKNAGVRTAFIGKYKCDLCRMLGNQRPDVIAADLKEFADNMGMKN